MIQVYKIINNIDCVDQDKFFTMSLNRTTRGHSKKIFKNRYRLNVRANSFSNRIVNTWNSLTESVVSAGEDIHTSSRLHAIVRTPQLPDETNIEIRQKKPEAYLLTSNRYERYEMYDN